MKGKIIGLSGPTATVDIAGLALYERVRLGQGRLSGEVVRLEKDHAVVQVYEQTRGLALGEPAEGLGEPLCVRLGPGLLSSMYDGLQRPLRILQEQDGPFIQPGREPSPLDPGRTWDFTPLKQPGETLQACEPFGFVEEGGFRHLISCPVPGRIAELEPGRFTLGSPLGRMAEGPELFLQHPWPARTPRPCRARLLPRRPLITGQRVLDFLFPLVKGGTAIFPGGFGTGKTVLEQTIARFADVDVVVYVGCGERGNEMAELLEEFTALQDPRSGRPLMGRTIVAANTSNMPVAAREASIYTAVTLAEYYRDMGLDVLLLADSLSRWAEALREISASLEEMPGEEGYPTYLGSRISAFFERAGVVQTLGGATGSLTLVLAVSPPGGDFTEPVTQACLRSAGAFYMLDTRLAHRRHFPAIHWGQSYSLYGRDLGDYFSAHIDPRWGELTHRCRDILHREEALQDVAEVVGMDGLQEADRLLMETAEKVRQDFLCQSAYGENACSSPQKTLERISGILDRHQQRSSSLQQPFSTE